MPTRYLVHDMDASLSFYVNLLGFTVAERWGPAFAIVEREGETLWLSGPQTSAAQPMPDGRSPEPGGWNRIVVEVDDFEAWHSKLVAAGITARNEPLTGPGGTQWLIEDPSGNPVELFQARG